MPDESFPAPVLASPSGMRAEFNHNGSLRRLDGDPITLNLFVGNEIEGGPTNLYLRLREGGQATPLLGPDSPTRFSADPARGLLRGTGSWHGIDYTVSFVLARTEQAWFWHVQLQNRTGEALDVDLTYVQDLALAAYGGVRMNEFYVSQYIDHTPLETPQRGWVLASRQNQAVDGRIPWSLIGSLRKAVSFATDARQFFGLSARAGLPPVGLAGELPNRRLQHEHSMVVIRDAPLRLEPGSPATTGFFGSLIEDHPAATAPADLERVDPVLALPEAQGPASLKEPPTIPSDSQPAVTATLFTASESLRPTDLDTGALCKLFPPTWRHEEKDEGGNLLSFFHGTDAHVVLRAKELAVLRPHGHLLRTGRHTVPDESGLTSTSWMSGVFHSMVTQGHVNINRMMSTVRTYLGLFRSQGQRVFIQQGTSWLLLDLPSAFEMTPNACRWIYRHAGGEVQVRAEAHTDPQQLTLSLDVTTGEPARFLISHHIALNGDDGSAPGAALWRREAEDVVVAPVAGSEIGQRFPQGDFRIGPLPGTQFERVGADELLFKDGRSRQQPYVCIVTAPGRSAGLFIRGNLIKDPATAALRARSADDLTPRLALNVRAASPLAGSLARLGEIAPWYAQNAFVHYLSPRGLEQFSGGGWGTRDVCQGPVELLLALGRFDAIRDLLLRVMAAQNPDGDWPQWFMFFDRERGIRAGDSHGDIVFWPLVVLGQYLLASGDASVLEKTVPFFDPRGPDRGERASVWRHVQRALALIDRRVVGGTSLAAYGHGDWNDALQPANPRMREHMCSAWTVTLHYQTLVTLARALRAIGFADQVGELERKAEAVRNDFQRILVVDGVLAGYALFEEGNRIRYLLHPSDDSSSVRYSSLAMIHAIIEDLFTPEQASQHLLLMESHLSAPDGLRLFDRPMDYHGGTQIHFQRAESATYFGREIGLMYTHAHLRYAQALAHVGEADRFFHALCQANPIGIRAVVPGATLRQSNCYYSSSDAAFDDRYQASAEYARVARGTIALDGGWRVYSSGAGIALGLIVRRFLGLSCESGSLRVDPVMPASLDGMRADTQLLGHTLEVRYRVGERGCGVTRVVLNRQALPFHTQPNPHRRGAAMVSLAAVSERLTGERNSLEIELG